MLQKKTLLFYTHEFNIKLKYEVVDYEITVENLWVDFTNYTIKNFLQQQTAEVQKKINIIGITKTLSTKKNTTRLGIVSTSSMAFKKRGKEHISKPTRFATITIKILVGISEQTEFLANKLQTLNTLKKIFRLGDTAIQSVETTFSGPKTIN